MPFLLRLLLPLLLSAWVLAGCGYKGRDGLNLPGQPPVKEEHLPFASPGG